MTNELRQFVAEIHDLAKKEQAKVSELQGQLDKGGIGFDEQMKLHSRAIESAGRSDGLLIAAQMVIDLAKKS